MRGHSIYITTDGRFNWIGHVAPFEMQHVRQIIKGRVKQIEDFTYITVEDGEDGHECVVFADVDAARLGRPRNNRAMQHWRDPSEVLHGDVMIFYGDEEFMRSVTP